MVAERCAICPASAKESGVILTTIIQIKTEHIHATQNPPIHDSAAPGVAADGQVGEWKNAVTFWAEQRRRTELYATTGVVVGVRRRRSHHPLSKDDEESEKGVSAVG